MSEAIAIEESAATDNAVACEIHGFGIFVATQCINLYGVVQSPGSTEPLSCGE